MSQTANSEQINPALLEFRAGVTAILRTWSALRAAVTEQWGGRESHEKAEDLRSNILDRFNGTKKVPMEVYDLEDNLLHYMEEEFSVVLEDDSEKQIAAAICRMYEECGRGDTSRAREMVKNAQKLEGLQQENVVVESSEMEDDEDMGQIPSHACGASVALGSRRGTPISPKEYASEDVFPGSKPKKAEATNQSPPRQLGESLPEKPAIHLDEDGFAPVTPRRSKRRSNKLKQLG